MLNIDSFLEYVATTQTTFSYKLVVLWVLLNNVNENGVALRESVISAFREYYSERARKGLAVEKTRERNPSPLLEPENVTDEQIWNTLVRYPLDLMEEFISFDDKQIWIRSELWTKLRASEFVKLRSIVSNRLQEYFEGIS